MKKKLSSRIIGAFLGTIVEYYDYGLYGFSAGIIASKFFPNTNHITSLMNVFAVYAVAYFAKPLGSLIFGRIGDLYGRKIVLNITIIGIAIPTMIIGILPLYSSIGIYSTIILILCRFMQGIFVGGEYDSAAIYVIEHLGKNFQFTTSSIIRCTGVVGLLLSIGAVNLFNSRIFPEWGWRIPFLLSLPLASVALYYRQTLDETAEFKQMQNNAIVRQNFTSLIKKQWQIILIAIFLTGSFGVTYQIAIIFMKQYLPLVLPQTIFIMSTFSTLIVICFAITMPITGLLADHIGPIIVAKISLFGTIIASLLLMTSLHYQMINLALPSCLMLAIFVAPFNGLAHGIMVNIFSVSERCRLISLVHNIGSMLMSGSANYICLVMIKSLNWNIFPIIYLTFFATLFYCMVKLLKRHNKNNNNNIITK